MSAIDAIVFFVFFIVFGIWFVIFPKSVIKFYTWFHKGKLIFPDNLRPERAVRISGILWLILILCVMIFGKPS